MKTFLIDTFLKRVLDGNKGSTLLGTVITPLLLAHVNWDLVLQGPHTQAAATADGQVAGIVVVAVWSFFIGRKQSKNSSSQTPTQPVSAALAN